MTEKTVFIAEDGSRFDDRARCEAYESNCRQINSIMEPLQEVEVRGARYYQHHPSTAKAVANALTQFAVNLIIPERKDEEWSPYGLIGRFVDDSSNSCLRRAFGRICRIDIETGREYEQPYYRLHPNEATEPV